MIFLLAAGGIEDLWQSWEHLDSRHYLFVKAQCVKGDLRQQTSKIGVVAVVPDFASVVERFAESCRKCEQWIAPFQEDEIHDNSPKAAIAVAKGMNELKFSMDSGKVVHQAFFAVLNHVF